MHTQYVNTIRKSYEQVYEQAKVHSLTRFGQRLRTHSTHRFSGLDHGTVTRREEEDDEMIG